MAALASPDALTSPDDVTPANVSAAAQRAGALLSSGDAAGALAYYDACIDAVAALKDHAAIAVNRGTVRFFFFFFFFFIFFIFNKNESSLVKLFFSV